MCPWEWLQLVLEVPPGSHCLHRCTPTPAWPSALCTAAACAHCTALPHPRAKHTEQMESDRKGSLLQVTTKVLEEIIRPFSFRFSAQQKKQSLASVPQSKAHSSSHFAGELFPTGCICEVLCTPSGCAGARQPACISIPINNTK